jgi:hypothetical protein
MKIYFLGDIALNGNYIGLYKTGHNPFSLLEADLNGSNYIVGNLECLANGNKGENELKKPRLSTTVETLNYLKTLNLDVACLAHNHIYDHLEDGFEKTTQFLTNNKINFMGAGLTQEEAAQPMILFHESIKVGMLNYVTTDTNPNLPGSAKVFLNIFNLGKAIADITLLKHKVDQVILLLHWGGRVEGGLYPDWNQPKIARKLIDAGADLIIGHHSHTIQPYEIYKGKHIFYSLGNFCFSDFSFEGKDYIMPIRRKNVILPQFSFSKTDYSVKITYWLNQGEQFTPKPFYKFSMYIRNLLFLTHRIRAIWNLYFFIHRKINPIVFYFTSNNLSLYQKMNKLNWDKIKRQIKK